LQERIQVIRQGDGQRRDGARTDNPEAYPAQKETRPFPICGLQEVVVPSCMGKHARHFGIGESPTDCQDPAQNPDAHKKPGMGQLTRQETAGGKNTCPDDIAHNEQNRIKESKASFQLHSVLFIPRHGPM